MTPAFHSRVARLAVLALAALALAPAPPAVAEEVVLAPRRQVGDSYALSLRADHETDASWRARDRNAFAERVQLAYAATVLVLEIDDAGRPVRERHENVRLTADRTDGSTSLFRDVASFEVRCTDGDVRIFTADGRIERKAEKIVVALLTSRIEQGVGPQLFAPGRAVEVGDSWALDLKLARRFLRERGVRAVQLDGAATATLAREAGGAGGSGLVVRYAIPVAWFEADDLPANARATESGARLEGEIRLASGESDGASGHSSTLSLHMSGVVSAPGVIAATPWRYESARRSDQRTEIRPRSYAAGF